MPAQPFVKLVFLFHITAQLIANLAQKLSTGANRHDEEPIQSTRALDGEFLATHIVRQETQDNA
jgi:hypothetical protein